MNTRSYRVGGSRQLPMPAPRQFSNSTWEEERGRRASKFNPTTWLSDEYSVRNNNPQGAHQRWICASANAQRRIPRVPSGRQLLPASKCQAGLTGSFCALCALLPLHCLTPATPAPPFQASVKMRRDPFHNNQLQWHRRSLCHGLDYVPVELLPVAA